MVNRKAGQIALELLFAVALMGVIATSLFGSLKLVSEACERTKERSMELRDEVWTVGLLTGPGGAAVALMQETDRSFPKHQSTGLVASSTAHPGNPELGILLVRHEKETLIEVQARQQEARWIIGGLPGTRRWSE